MRAFLILWCLASPAWSAGVDVLSLSQGNTSRLTYERLVRRFNPTMWVRMGESSGSVMVEQASGLTGTYYNSPTLGSAGALSGFDDAKRTAALFDGTNDNASVMDGPAFTATNLTIVALVKSTAGSFGASRRTVFAQQPAGATYLIFSLIDGVLEIGCSLDIGIVAKGSDLSDDAWHHIAGVRDTVADFWYWYVDGVQVGSQATANNTEWNQSTKISLGGFSACESAPGECGNPNTSNPIQELSGTVADVLFFNYALTANQIASLSTCALSGICR